MANRVNVKWFLLPLKLFRLEYSIAPGALLGLVALILQQLYLYNQSRYLTNSNNKILDILNNGSVVWLIGACFGSLVSGLKRKIWPNRLTYTIIGIVLLVIVGGNIEFYENEITDVGNILNQISGFLGGFLYGFIYIVLISYIADNASKNYRGFVSTNITMIEIAAALFPLFTNMKFYFSITIGFIGIAFIFTWLCTYESVTSSLEFNKTVEAERIFTRLHSKVLGLAAIHNEIVEKIEMMNEERNENDECFMGIFRNGNWKPLLWISGLHLTCLLALIQASMFTSQSLEFNFCLILSRLFTLIISRFTLDYIGRKWLTWFSCCGCIIGMAITTICFFSEDFMTHDSYGIILFMWSMSLSLGLEPVKNLYTCEAFPISKRNGSVAFVTIIVYGIGIIQRILWINYLDSYGSYFLIGGNITLVALMLPLLLLPETKRKSLRECQMEFNSYYEEIKHFEPSAPAPET